MADLTTISEHRCFGGLQGFYAHVSEACSGEMRFGLFQPPQALAGETVPVVTWLSGLTCTEENFVIKAGAQRMAAELGLIVVAPDTSPRGAGVPGEDEGYDLGTGAGFYVDASQAPWSKAYRMYSYVTRELPAAVAAGFPADMARQGIFGHSMGGHGALVLALRMPEVYRSVSAFAPICNPMDCPWGQKALGNYLGAEQDAWAAYDACRLIESRPSGHRILVDQGSDDQFLQVQLKPERLAAACSGGVQALDLRMQPGYDHSYYFIQTFMADHIAHHAAVLNAL
jgi:S-formylglutathione hydrolase